MILEVNELPPNSRIVLHICCGPCLSASVDSFASVDSNLLLYFYNPNIHPFSEYLKRRESLLAWLKLKNLPYSFQEGPYNLKDYFQAVSGFERYPERCRFCYRLRLHETARLAAEIGFDYFSTTIFASPYQQHEVALEEALRAGETFDLAVVHFKLEKKDYRHKVEEYKKNGLYYQNYCGCLYSELEKYEKAR